MVHGSIECPDTECDCNEGRVCQKTDIKMMFWGRLVFCASGTRFGTRKELVKRIGK